MICLSSFSTAVFFQGFDGASVMSGIYNGVQAIIKSKTDNPVPFVHCATHNLCLVIKDVVSGTKHTDDFFDCLAQVGIKHFILLRLCVINSILWLTRLKYCDIKMLINVNRLNLIARSIYSNVSYRYIFVIGPFT